MIKMPVYISDKKNTFWIISLLCCIGLASGWGLSLYIRGIDTARSMSCLGCVTCIATAMQDYYDKYGSLPPAYLTNETGRPMHSWRVLLLEFIEPDLFAEYKFDEPWNGPHNQTLRGKMPSCYGCPADLAGQAMGRTNYFVVIGNDTAFPGARSVTFGDIQRPRSDTILFVEAVEQNICWLEPRDLDLESVTTMTNESTGSISSYHRGGPFVCMVDTSKKQLDDTDKSRLSAMLRIK